MFIGHYGVALGLKKTDKTVSLGLLFLAVQLVDVLWTVFVLFGIEKVAIVPGLTATNPLDFVYYPFTHGLLMSFVWAGMVYILFRFFPKASTSGKTALIMGLAVLSHFFLDLLVHRPDLPVAFGADSPKLGFGLWNFPAVAYVLESLVFLAGLWIYLKATTASSFAGKYGMIIFAIFLLVANLANLFGPPPSNVKIMAAFGLFFYLLFAAIAFWLDKKRI